MKSIKFRRKALILFSVFLLIISPVMLQAQSRHGVFNITEIGYGKGIGRIDYGELGLYPNDGKMGRFRTIFGHYLGTKMSLGAGIGLDGYTGSTGPRYNTMPVFLDFRAYLKDTMYSPFAFIEAGYTIKIGDMFEKGAFGAIGVGYKKGFSRWGSLLISANANLHQIKDDETLVVDYSTNNFRYIKNDLLLYSLSVNVGLLIK